MDENWGYPHDLGKHHDLMSCVASSHRNPELRSALPVSCVEELLQAMQGLEIHGNIFLGET